MTKAAKFYIAAVVAPGAVALLWAVLHWDCPQPEAFAFYLAIAVVLGILRIKLPGLVGTYSMGFLPVLYGLNHFSGAEVLLAAAVSAVAGCTINAKNRPTFSQVLFNSSNLTLSAASCLFTYHFMSAQIPYHPAVLCAMVALYFAVNTALVSGILSLVQRKPFSAVCEAWYLTSFIYYVAGAALLGLATSSSGQFQAWFILLPIAYLMWFFWQIKSTPMPSAAPAQTADIPRRARYFVYAIAAAGAGLLAVGLAQWVPLDSGDFAFCLALAALAAGCKVRLPGMLGSFSTSFVVILFAAFELQMGEALSIAAVVGLVQSYCNASKRPRPTQVIFNVGNLIVSTAAAFAACHSVASLFSWQAALLPSLVAATVAYYGCNSVMTCVVLGLVEHKSISVIWSTCQFWSLPYYMVGSAASGIMVAVSRTAGFQAAFLVLTVIALVFLAYSVHLKDARLRYKAVAVG
jgi:hypothetical protein